MLSLMAAFCAGVIILYCHGHLLPWFYYIFVIALVPIVIPILTCRRLLPIGLSFVLGTFYLSSSAQDHIESKLPLDWEGKTVYLTGFACSLPRYRAHFYSLEFCVQKMALKEDGEAINKHGIVRMKLTGSYPEPGWQKGTYRLVTKLKRPRSTANPLGFSYEQYLFYKRIVAMGSIKHSQLLEQDQLAVNDSFLFKLTSIRIALRDRLDRLLKAREHQGLITALVLGDKSGITHEDAEALKQTGTQHLLAISGLHVGLVMLLLLRMLPLGIISCVIVMGIGFVYILLVGFGPSAQRAWLMCSIACFALQGFRAARAWQSYFLAMTLVLVVEPLSVMNSGFWYSFVAVGLLLLLLSLKLVSTNYKAVVFSQIMILLALLPLNTAFLMPQGWEAALANLVAIPWVSVVILPGSLIALVSSYISSPTAEFIYTVINEILHMLMTFLASIPGDILIAPQMHWLELSVYCVVFVALKVFFRLPVLAGLLGVALGVYLMNPEKVADTQSEVVIFDVGQGLSVFIRQGADAWLYDLGPAYERSSSYHSIVLPYVRSYTDSLTGMIISHGDNDHAGAHREAFEQLDPKHVWTGERERIDVPSAQSCSAGMSWKAQALSIRVLFPTMDYRADSSNSRSCVIRVELKDKVFILMGDLEGAAEQYFLENVLPDLKADVLVAGHHGSNNATSYALLKRIAPRWVVFSAGYRNRFGHPHSEVLKRVDVMGAQSLNTADLGAIRFVVSDSGLKYDYVRHDARPFWMEGPRSINP